MLRMGFMPVFNADEGNGGTVPTPPPAPPTPGTPTPDQASGVTQADIDKAAAAARRQGEKDGISRFLSEMGFEKPDDLKSMIQAFKEKQDAELSETERYKKQVATLEAEKQTALEQVALAKRQALEEKRDSIVKEKLGLAKYPKMIISDLKMDGKLDSVINEAGEIDEKAIDALIVQCKKDSPDLFRSDNPGAPSHAGAQPQNLNAEALKKAADEMRQRARL